MIFKTILRLIRKCLKEDFYEMIDQKVWKYKGKSPIIFLEDNTNFIEEIFPENGPAETKEIIFFFGSLVKPKIMLKHFHNDATAKKKINGIKNALNIFSINKLEYLNTYPGFRPILEYFINKHASKLMKKN